MLRRSTNTADKLEEFLRNIDETILNHMRFDQELKAYHKVRAEQAKKAQVNSSCNRLNNNSTPKYLRIRSSASGSNGDV